MRVLLGAWVACTAALLLLVLLRPVAARPPATGADDADADAAGAKFSPEAAAIFGKRCTACHTYGKGVKVGPDLKGVTERRKREWLLKFIHASSVVIKSGDPTATQLFAQFKQQRMPDWVDLSDKQINDILDYLSIGGPDIKPLDEHDAATASSADIERGRQLFYGEKPLKYGAQACANCHAVQGGMRGGSLGPNLSKVYFRYQDLALTYFLREPCFQWDTGGSADIYLAPKESFSIKSFLRTVALQNQASLAANERNGGGRSQ
jgi:mono/diheme cytochrome c family protein